MGLILVHNDYRWASKYLFLLAHFFMRIDIDLTDALSLLVAINVAVEAGI